ncbi:MAG: hypothetical protein JXO22_12630 [Phycisphaerae bacterium]|nr:hypothetical protein [Phycisphaerae bacterium]
MFVSKTQDLGALIADALLLAVGRAEQVGDGGDGARDGRIHTQGGGA